MSVGQPERATQNRIVALFREELKYRYLGDWTDRDGNSNIEETLLPVVLHAWLRHPRDFRAAIMGVLACGGDTDTTGAITGSIVGAGVGRAGLPEDWLANLWEWPCGAAWIERVATRLAESLDRHQPLAAVPTNVPLLVLRNGLFACIVLTHGFRRLLPPYG